MKLTPTAALTALCWTARLVSAATGHVYILDPHLPRTEGDLQSLSPVSARLVLAQRAGVEDYHSADLVDSNVINAVNEFGVRTPLFGKDGSKRMPRAMVLVEGVVDAEAEMPSLRDHAGFALTPAPGATATRGLWIDLAKQSRPSIYSHLSDDEAAERMQDFHTQFAGLPDDVFYIASSMSDLEAVVKSAKLSKHYAITTYIAPANPSVKSDNTKISWGTYEMPSVQSPLQKRSAKRPQQSEKPLEFDEANIKEIKPVQSTSMPISTFSNSSTTPLAGILPGCFTSQSQCESMTRNCTGHGRCHRKYSDPSAADQSRNKECYTCQCVASVQTSSDGRKKTTYYGGPACQKRDISVHFWIIALFSVGMVFLVGFAVGEVWGMGSETLPSVIGAGVSGPPRR